MADLGGGGGLSRGFLAPSCVVTTVDSDPSTGPDVVADLLTWTPPAAPFDTVLLRYVLHYLSDRQVRALFASMTGWRWSNVLVVQFANQRPEDKAANSADTDDRHWRTPAELVRLLHDDLPAWLAGPRVNRLDYTVHPEFYGSRLGVPGKYPHGETLLGLNLERRA